MECARRHLGVGRRLALGVEDLQHTPQEPATRLGASLRIQLRNAQKMFNLFDAQRTGRVTLDFNQFVWSIAQL